MLEHRDDDEVLGECIHCGKPLKEGVHGFLRSADGLHGCATRLFSGKKDEPVGHELPEVER